MPKSLTCQKFPKIKNWRQTDVDDDGDAVGQREVTAEISFYDIEVLLLITGDMERYHWQRSGVALMA